ncbi:MAG: ribonuclease P protein component [Gammaproteobacteria bacterium]
MPVGELGFARTDRLLKPAQFRRVFQHPTKSMDDFFTVLCRPSNLASPRLGMAVSKKYARRAVDRNRIKRIIRESFRCNRNDLGGIDYVVLNRKGADNIDNSILFESLSRHWKRL